ncbi:hypothetical protein [Bacillus dakarensis]|jgi:hypothetical protein|uniref:hypothetical protein n=1 Tax=Robertmurraya dakarensis TaxID=1926278 RepID=UPI000980E7C1|nr:hypothetical protein [Bacillus dakarensis]
MINVKPTAKHIKSIKKHKRFLEKWKMWGFAYYDGEDYYFAAQYTQITGSLTGYLILNQDGEDLPLSQVLSQAYYLVRYNTMVHNTISAMVPQMAKSRKTYEEMLGLLKNNQHEIVKQRPDLTEAVRKMIELNEYSVKMSDKIREIVYRLGGYQRDITQGRGYFDQKFFDVMDDEYGKYSELMYKYGIQERDLQKDYARLSEALDISNISISSSDKRKLKTLLKATQETNEKELTKSLETFEKDDQGNQLYIDLNNIKESLAKNREDIGKRDFQKITVPIIRNKS